MLFAWYAQEMFKGSDIVRILLFLCVCEYLPDSGKLQGRKLSRIGEKHDFHRENFEDYSLLLRQRTPHPHILQEKTSANSHKTAIFAKVFSLESFPLFGIN